MEYTVLCGLLFVIFHQSHGFLLDDKTTSAPNQNHAISTKEFNDLVILVSSERIARVKLEQRVTQLENELLQTQKGLTDVYHENQRHNASVANQNNLIASLASENAALKSKYDALELVNKELGTNLNRTETELNSVKNRMSQLEQIKAVSELQLVLNLQNETKHLQDELQSTNAKLDRVSNENNARKDDIIALYNQVRNNENKMIIYAKNTSEEINRTSHTIVEKLSKNISDLSQNQNETAKQLTQKIGDLKHNQNQTAEQLTQKIVHLDQFLNVTSNRIDRELHNMSGRALLTACAADNTYSGGSKILFPAVKTRYGVGDRVISELGTAGNYVVESSGIYLITAYIMTTAQGHYDVIVNNRLVAYSYFNTGTNAKTTAVTVSERLKRNDIIYIKVYTNMYINGNQYSCLTILQLAKD